MCKKPELNLLTCLQRGSALVRLLCSLCHRETTAGISAQQSRLPYSFPPRGHSTALFTETCACVLRENPRSIWKRRRMIVYFSWGHRGRLSPTKTLLYRHNRRSKGNAGCPSYPALCILCALHCFCSNNHTCKNTPPRLRLSLYTRPLSQKNAKITH